jgi:hypothetical protein
MTTSAMRIATIEDRENECVKNGFKGLVERAIDEDLGCVIWWSSTFRHFFFEAWAVPDSVETFDACRITSFTAVLSAAELTEDGGCFGAGTRRSG